MIHLERAVNAFMTSLHTKGITVTCERCFYLTDPNCPTAPHKCELEDSIKNGSEEEKAWVLENLKDKIEMRRKRVD